MTEKAPAPKARRLTDRFGPMVWLAAVVGLWLALAGCESHKESVALYRKANSLWEGGQHIDAARSFITISEIYPGSPLVEDSLFWAANLYHHFLGNVPLAERYYQQLMVRFPEGEHFHPSLEAVAELYAQERETRYKAILTYRKLMLAEAVAPRRDRYLLRIAEAYVGLGRLEEARFELRKLITQYRSSTLLPQAYYLAGYSYYWEGRKPLAVIALNQIGKDFPDEPIAVRARFFVAEIYEEEGSLRKALEVYESLRGAYHNPTILDKRLEALRARMNRSVR